MNCRRLLVSGIVQGVGYRAFVASEAGQRSLTGFVRNLRDGRVEAVLCGGNETLDDMMMACRKGPAMSRVTEIASEEVADQGFPDFRVLPTA